MPATSPGPVATRPVRVVVADDSTEFLQAAADVVRAADGFEVVGLAQTGADALAAASALEPDLVLLDVRMPRLGGIEAARLITSLWPGTVVVLITGGLEAGVRERARSCGAVVALDKRDLRPATLAQLWKRHGHETTRPG